MTTQQHPEPVVRALAQDLLIASSNMTGERFNKYKAQFEPDLWIQATEMAAGWKRRNKENAMKRTQSP